MAEEKILVVDDEDHIVELISYNLINSGYKVITANNGIDAVKLAKEENPRLMLLDLMIPGLDGYDLCKAIRSDNDPKDISVIMLTAKGEELDKILGLELGADDYITKPFHIKEVTSRIKAVFRRIEKSASKDNKNFIKINSNVKINFNNRTVLKNDEVIQLKPKEYELLEFFVQNRNKVFSREQLIDNIWEFSYDGDIRTVDIHIRRIRSKLDTNGQPSVIETVFGVGYMMR